MQAVILGSPDFYEIRYSINPLTNKRSKVDPLRAKREFECLLNKFKKYKIPTHVIPVKTPAFPDFIYVSNSALILRGWPQPTAILSRYAHPERQGEEQIVGAYLKALGFKVIELPYAEGCYFEGQGDCRWSNEGKDLWFAYGAGRSTNSGIEAVEKAILEEAAQQGWQPPKFHRLHIVEKTTYHMDLCFLPLPNGKVLFHGTSFDTRSRHHIEHAFGKSNIVDIPLKYLYICNSVWLDEKNLLIPKLDNGHCKKWMHEKTRMHIEEVNVSEFQLAGGSVSCMVLPFWSTVK